MKPNQYSPVQAQPSPLKTLQLAVPDPDNFQRVAFLCDFSTLGSPTAYQMDLSPLVDFGSAKGCIVDAKYCPFDTILAISDSVGDYVTIPAGQRVRFNLPALPQDSFTLYNINAAASNPLGYVRVYFDNVPKSDNGSDVLADSVEYLYIGSITAAGAATPISVIDGSGENGLPLISRWGYIAPQAHSTAAGELDVALTLSGNYADGNNPLPWLSSNIGAAVGDGTDGLVSSPKSRVIWLPTAVPTPLNEGQPKTYTATPSFPNGVPAGFAVTGTVLVYLWANRGMK